MKKEPKSFWIIFKVPESIIVFLSGILVSAAINMITSIYIPSKMEPIPYNTIWSAGFMIIAALLLIAWATIVKPCQDTYYHTTPNERKWDRLIKENNNHIKLLVVLLGVLFFCGLSIVYLK